MFILYQNKQAEMPSDQQIVTINQFFAGGVSSAFDSVVLFTAERALTISSWNLELEVFLDQIDAAVANNLAIWGIQRFPDGLNRPAIGQGDVQEANFSNSDDTWERPHLMLGYGPFGFPIFLNAVELDVYTPMQHKHTKYFEGDKPTLMKEGDRLLFTFNTSNFLSGAPFVEVFGICTINYVY